MTLPTPLNDLQVLRAACCVAGLDGAVCEREQPILRRLAERAGVGKASFDAMIDMAVRDRGRYEQQLGVLTADPDGTLKALFRVAASDGTLDVEERVVLQYFAKKLEVDQDRFETILAAAEREAASAGD